MALAAYVEDLPRKSGKPREARRKIRLEVPGALPAGDEVRLTVHNISATGMLIEGALELAHGDALSIDLPDAKAVRAKVVWSSGALFGCAFEEALGKATLSAAELRGAVDRDVQTGPEPAETLASRLQRLRKAKGLSLSKFAEALSVSKPTAWAWEQGRAKPIESRIEAIAATLGVSTTELLSGRDEAELNDILSRSRKQIADHFGIGPDAVRIMIEL